MYHEVLYKTFGGKVRVFSDKAMDKKDRFLLGVFKTD